MSRLFICESDYTNHGGRFGIWMQPVGDNTIIRHIFLAIFQSTHSHPIQFRPQVHNSRTITFLSLLL